MLSAFYCIEWQVMTMSMLPVGWQYTAYFLPTDSSLGLIMTHSLFVLNLGIIVNKLLTPWILSCTACRAG